MPPSKQKASKAGNKSCFDTGQSKAKQHSLNGSWHRVSQTVSTETFHLPEPGKYATLDECERKQLEVSFTFPVDIPLQGDWTRSERYWLQKDREMSAYLEDWSLSKWLINPAEAKDAFDAMQARMRLRNDGKSVYSEGAPKKWLTRHISEHVQSTSSRKAQPSAEATIQAVPPPKAGNKLNLRFPSRPSIQSITEAASEHGANEESEGLNGNSTRPRRTTTLSKRYVERQDENAPPLKDQDQRPTKRQRTGRKTQVDVLTTAESYEVDTPVVSDGEFPPNGNQQGSKRKKRKASDHPVLEPKFEMWSKDDKHDKMEEPSRPPYHHGYDTTKGPDLPWEASYATEEAEEWDDGIYDQARLEHLEKVHDRNKAVVGAYMGGGRTDAGTRKNAASKAAKANEEIERPSVGPIPLAVRPDNKRPKNKKSGLADQREHFSGRLAFADQENWEKFQTLPYNTIEEAIEAAMADPFDKNLMSIEVTHDPGDSILSNLDLPRISIMDIARTRLQLFHIRVITKRAAECMIDFCPDLLLGFRLIQVVSETDFGNTGIQFRLGYNGSMLSDSTLTKRISSAVALEHNKTRAAEANKADKDFHKEHRKNYNKYKVWRAWKRDHSISKPNTFSLAEAARQYRDSKTKEDAGAKLFASLKPKRKISGSTTSSSGSASSSKAGSRRSSFAKTEVDKSKTASQLTTAIDGLRDLSKDEGGTDDEAMMGPKEDNKSVLDDKSSPIGHPRLDEGPSNNTVGPTDGTEENHEAITVQDHEPMESVIKVAVSGARASSPGAGQNSLFSFFTSEPAPKRTSIRK